MSASTFLQKYKVLHKIGEGSFSEVLKCEDLRNGSFLAAKRLKKRFSSWEEVNDCAEIIAMHKLPHHLNILHMIEFHYDSFLGKVTFLFELMDMSLYDFINMRKRYVHEARAKYYLYQILSGLDHLHKNGMFHRDIKPENILLKLPEDACDSVKYETVKIADLGSLRGIYSCPPFTEYISTRWYRSPECLLTAGFYGPKMDVWAAGCVFYELLSLKPLFAGSNEVDQLSKIHKILGTPGKRTLSKFLINKSCNCDYFPKLAGKGLSTLLPTASSDGQSVLQLMITYDPDMRTNIRRLLEHRYFKQFRENEHHIKLPVGKKRSLSVESSGDYKISGRHSDKSSSKKSPTSQVIAKYQNKLKRSYNEIYSNKESAEAKEVTRKADNYKILKRSCNNNDTVAHKKFKLSDSNKSLMKKKVDDEVKPPSKEIKKLSKMETNDKKVLKDIYYKEPKITILQPSPRKYKLESDTYRKTTGNIPQIFNKHEKSKPIMSQSFVEKKTTKHSGTTEDLLDDLSKLRAKHVKVPVKHPRKK